MPFLARRATMRQLNSNSRSVGTVVLCVVLSSNLFGCNQRGSFPSETETFESQPMTSGGGESRIESPEAFTLLTREESFGLACLPLELRPNFGVCKATNPSARKDIARILTMDENRGVEVRDYQIGAMYCLGYIGEDEDVLAIEHFLRTGHKYANQPFGIERFRTAFDGIALMARRDVPEAKRIMADIVRPEYWKEIATPLLYFDGLSPLEEDLVLAVYASAIVNGGPVSDLINRTIESCVHKDAMAKFLSPELVNRASSYIVESEKQPVSDQWRELLQKLFQRQYTDLVREYGDATTE